MKPAGTDLGGKPSPPVRVVTRGSTGYGAMRDPVLSKAIDHIRRHAKSGEADVAAVARAYRLERRAAHA